ncbi:hypothetical protein ACIBI8_16950 [Streptomyces sp. NPDC050529]|uniref:hypothetical protein n=1 Tax=unclassified Streptomyces TaxID=2593676 RepID=UPI002DD7CF2E|nr:hypothetical protein [Streptomyces sp. NBC_01022]WRZ85950.1 hypothetical protein OG316_39560 [Streptomyces sp. NBC_01022]
MSQRVQAGGAESGGAAGRDGDHHNPGLRAQVPDRFGEDAADLTRQAGMRVAWLDTSAAATDVVTRKTFAGTCE